MIYFLFDHTALPCPIINLIKQTILPHVDIFPVLLSQTFLCDCGNGFVVHRTYVLLCNLVQALPCFRERLLSLIVSVLFVGREWRFCNSSSCQRGTTAAIGRPARSIINCSSR